MIPYYYLLQDNQQYFTVASSWLDSETIPSNLDASHIVLAPKGDNLKSKKDLQPIFLCNVLYKIISKVLANRLRPLIDKWIYPEQAAFVPSRSIMDNALTTFEILHYMRSKHEGKIGDVALKLDTSKAIDSIYASRVSSLNGSHG